MNVSDKIQYDVAVEDPSSEDNVQVPFEAGDMFREEHWILEYWKTKTMRQDGDENAMHLEVEEFGQRCTKENVDVQIERSESMMTSARFSEWYVEKGISDFERHRC